MPGGIVPSLSEATRARILKACPGVDVASIESAFQHHSMVLAHDSEPARDVRKKLSGIAKQAVMLRVEMQTMSEEARDALWDALSLHDGPLVSQAIIDTLSRLSGAAREAHNATELRGKSPSKWYPFVRTIARIMSSAGIEVSDSRRGPLYQVINILRSEFRVGPGEISKLIENSLEKYPAKP